MFMFHINEGISHASQTAFIVTFKSLSSGKMFQSNQKLDWYWLILRGRDRLLCSVSFPQSLPLGVKERHRIWRLPGISEPWHGDRRVFASPIRAITFHTGSDIKLDRLPCPPDLTSWHKQMLGCPGAGAGWLTLTQRRAEAFPGAGVLTCWTQPSLHLPSYFYKSPHRIT